MAIQKDRFDGDLRISTYTSEGVLPHTAHPDDVMSAVTRARRPGIESVRQLNPTETVDLLHQLTSKFGGLTRRQRTRVTHQLLDTRS